MRKNKTEISVRAVFGGKQEVGEVFVGLLVEKIVGQIQNQKLGVETNTPSRYNGDKVFSCVRVEKEEEVA